MRDRSAALAAPSLQSWAPLRPVAVFAAVYVVGEWLLSLGGTAGGLRPLSLWTAAVTGRAACATGVNAIVDGTLVLIPDRVLNVSADCTGVFLLVAYAALVIAQPVSWKTRAIGIAAGIPVLLLLNIGRLVLITHVSGWLPEHYDLLHDFLFQGLMVLSALVVWLVWMSATSRGPGRTECA